jgi:hypothetical protein
MLFIFKVAFTKIYRRVKGKLFHFKNRFITTYRYKKYLQNLNSYFFLGLFICVLLYWKRVVYRENKQVISYGLCIPTVYRFYMKA